MVLVIQTQELTPRVTCLPFGATHSGHSVGPASLHYRHSSRPLAAPPGTARGHRHTLGVDKGGQELPAASVLPLLQDLHDCCLGPGY